MLRLSAASERPAPRPSSLGAYSLSLATLRLDHHSPASQCATDVTYTTMLGRHRDKNGGTAHPSNYPPDVASGVYPGSHYCEN